MLFPNTDNVYMDMHEIYSAKRLFDFRMLHEIIDLGQNDIHNNTASTAPLYQNLSTNNPIETHPIRS